MSVGSVCSFTPHEFTSDPDIYPRVFVVCVLQPSSIRQFRAPRRNRYTFAFGSGPHAGWPLVLERSSYSVCGFGVVNEPMRPTAFKGHKPKFEDLKPCSTAATGCYDGGRGGRGRTKICLIGNCSPEGRAVGMQNPRHKISGPGLQPNAFSPIGHPRRVEI